jgi:hypothetical protein
MEDVNETRIRSSQNQKKKGRGAFVKMENGYFTRSAFENLDIVVGFVLFVVPSQDWYFA